MGSGRLVAVTSAPHSKMCALIGNRLGDESVPAKPKWGCTLASASFWRQGGGLASWKQDSLRGEGRSKLPSVPQSLSSYLTAFSMPDPSRALGVWWLQQRASHTLISRPKCGKH